MINKIKAYLQGVMTETKKVNWPSRQEIINHTLVVIIAIIILTIIFGTIDLGLSKILERVILWR